MCLFSLAEPRKKQHRYLGGLIKLDYDGEGAVMERIERVAVPEVTKQTAEGLTVRAESSYKTGAHTAQERRAGAMGKTLMTTFAPTDNETMLSTCRQLLGNSGKTKVVEKVLAKYNELAHRDETGLLKPLCKKKLQTWVNDQMDAREKNMRRAPTEEVAESVQT